MRLSIKEARRLGLVAPEAAKLAPAATKRARTAKRSSKERAALFVALCVARGLPKPEPEFRFHPTRRWRFDFLFPGNLALEVEGGIWNNGAHVRGAHFLSDCAKYNEAALMGYTVLRVSTQQVDSGEVFELLARALKVS